MSKSSGGPKASTFIRNALVAGAGVLGLLLLINWGRKNDIPVLKQAAEALDN